MITPNQWVQFRNAMKLAHDSFNKQPIIWKHAIVTNSPFGEDSGFQYSDRTLLGLVQYNWFRTWPNSKETGTGTVDKESVLVIFNIEYLKEQLLVNEHNYFMFDPGNDYFIINGIKYRGSGDSQLSQAHNEPLLFFLILRREETLS